MLSFSSYSQLKSISSIYNCGSHLIINIIFQMLHIFHTFPLIIQLIEIEITSTLLWRKASVLTHNSIGSDLYQDSIGIGSTNWKNFTSTLLQRKALDSNIVTNSKPLQTWRKAFGLEWSNVYQTWLVGLEDLENQRQV